MMAARLLPLDRTKVRRDNRGAQRRTAYRHEDDVERAPYWAWRAQAHACEDEDSRDAPLRL